MAGISSPPPVVQPDKSTAIAAPVDIDAQLVKGLVKEYGEGKADFLKNNYEKLITQMEGNHFNPSQILNAIKDLEKAVKKVSHMFRLCGVDEYMTRKWLVDVISKQLKKGKPALEPSDNFNVIATFKIGGPKNLYSLVNAARGNMGFFERMHSGFPVHEVTEEAWDALFGDQSGTYDEKKDDVTIEKFIDKMEKEVLVFAGTMSSEPLEKTLQLFAAKKFILMDKDDMARSVRTRLRELARVSIGKSNKTDAEKKSLLAEVDKYLSDGQFESQPDFSGFIEKAVLNANEEGGVNAQGKKVPLDYFGQIQAAKDKEFSALFFHLKDLCMSALSEQVSDQTHKIDAKQFRNILCLAGLAAIVGPFGLKGKLESSGDGDEVFELGKKNPAALRQTAMDYGINDLTDTWSIGSQGSLSAHMRWMLKIGNKALTDELNKKPEFKTVTPELAAAPAPAAPSPNNSPK